jgi:FecR protein
MRQFPRPKKTLFALCICCSIPLIGIAGCVTNLPPKPFSSEVVPTDSIAEISEIRNFPVRVRYLNGKTDRPVNVGAVIRPGERISTDENSVAQVTLKDGSLLRLGGQGGLTLQPKNVAVVEQGKLVVWKNPEQKQPLQINTNFGEITTEDSTFYLEIPTKPTESSRLMALNGSVTLKPKSGKETITLKKGQEVVVQNNGTVGAVKDVDKETIDKRIAGNVLLFGFSSPLASQSKIEADFGITVAMREANTIKFRRADIPNFKPDPSASKSATTTRYEEKPERRERQNSRDNSEAVSNRDSARDGRDSGRGSTDSNNAAAPEPQRDYGASGPGPAETRRDSEPVQTPANVSATDNNAPSSTPTQAPPSNTATTEPPTPTTPVDAPPLPVQPEIAPPPAATTPVPTSPQR